MKTKPVQIDISDKRLFAQIAFLVDSPTFLDLIQKVRTKFQIAIPFASGNLDSWHNHVLKLAGYDLDTYWKMEKIEPDNKEWKIKSDWLKATEQNFVRMTQIENDFMGAIAKIRKLHHYPVLFDSVIRQAILFHRITDFKTAMAVLTYNNMPTTPDEDDPIMAIIITPHSSKSDVLSAFGDAQKLKKQYEFANPLDKKLDKDTVTNIERNRNWHWSQYSGNTYKEILNDWNDTCTFYREGKEHPNGQKCEYCGLENQNMIERAVARYRQNLQLILPKTDI